MGSAAAYTYTFTAAAISEGHEFQPWVDRLDLTTDGRILAASGRFDLSWNGSRVAVFDVPEPGRPVLRWCDPPDREATLQWGLAWLPSGLLAAAEWVGEYPSYRGRIVLREAATGRAVKAIDRPGSPTDTLVTSAEGVLLAWTKGTLLAWPRADLDLAPRVIRNESRKHFTAVAFHPSGRYLAATSNDTTVKLYDTETWRLDRTFTWDVGRLRSVAFSPDGALAAVGSDTGRVVVWDVDL